MYFALLDRDYFVELVFLNFVRTFNLPAYEIIYGIKIMMGIPKNVIFGIKSYETRQKKTYANVKMGAARKKIGKTRIFSNSPTSRKKYIIIIVYCVRSKVFEMLILVNRPNAKGLYFLLFTLRAKLSLDALCFINM